MCTFAADKFGADSGSSDMGLADFVIGKADRNGNLFKVHADEGIADINSGIGLDFFQGDRMLKGLVSGGCKGTAGFGLGNDIDQFRIRNGRLFNDDGTVQVLAALGGKINAACLCRFINSGKNSSGNIEVRIAADLISAYLGGRAADYKNLSFVELCFFT